jgi:hypothetical protein
MLGTSRSGINHWASRGLSVYMPADSNLALSVSFRQAQVKRGIPCLLTDVHNIEHQESYTIPRILCTCGGRAMVLRPVRKLENIFTNSHWLNMPY